MVDYNLFSKNGMNGWTHMSSSRLHKARDDDDDDDWYHLYYVIIII